MHEPLNVGVIGCGRVAQAQHLRVLSSLASVRLAALADADEASLNKAAERYAGQAKLYPSYQAMLEQADIHAVVICLPTALHADAAIAAFEAGKAVYLEKPIGVDLFEPDRIVQAHAASKSPVQMGFNYRYHPAYINLRNQLKSGRIGTIAAVSSVFCSPPRKLQGWKTARSTGGGVLLDLFVHHADLASFLLDQQIASVFATSRSVQTEDDTASVLMTTEEGLTIQTTVSSVAAQADTFSFTGDKGSLQAGRFGSTTPAYRPMKLSYAKKDRLVSAANAIAAVPGKLAMSLFPPIEPSYQHALVAFVDRVRCGQAPAPGLEAGYRAALVVEAAETSARTGTLVRIDQDHFADQPAEVAQQAELGVGL